MGRVDEKSSHHNHGQETIDDALPPPDIGRHDPSNRGSSPLMNTSHQQRSVIPSGNNPQPPMAPPPHEEDLYYVPSKEQGNPASFPRQNYNNQDNYHNYNHDQVHVFPPQSHQNMGMPPQYFAQQASVHVPQHGGAVQMGQPVAPFNINMNNTAAQNQDQPWSSSLFDCMDDPQNALITACFPCVTFGQIAEILDAGNTTCATSGMLYGLIAFCIAAPCIMSCSYRTKLRARYGLIESPAQDWIVHCFCEWCSLCQEYRQLKHHGIDPTIGWLGNNQATKNQHNQYPMAAPTGQRMMM